MHLYINLHVILSNALECSIFLLLIICVYIAYQIINSYYCLYIYKK